jgi:hypothetical protein
VAGGVVEASAEFAGADCSLDDTGVVSSSLDEQATPTTAAATATATAASSERWIRRRIMDLSLLRWTRTANAARSNERATPVHGGAT